MTRLSLFNSPFLLGFDDLERLMDSTAKASSDGYPPYNIEQVGEDGLKITLALAGFAEDDLTVMIEDRQLNRPRKTAGRQKPHLFASRHCRAPISTVFCPCRRD